jgi:hypothetical protein
MDTPRPSRTESETNLRRAFLHMQTKHSKTLYSSAHSLPLLIQTLTVYFAKFLTCRVSRMRQLDVICQTWSFEALAALTCDDVCQYIQACIDEDDSSTSISPFLLRENGLSPWKSSPGFPADSCHRRSQALPRASTKLHHIRFD